MENLIRFWAYPLWSNKKEDGFTVLVPEWVAKKLLEYPVIDITGDSYEESDTSIVFDSDFDGIFLPAWAREYSIEDDWETPVIKEIRIKNYWENTQKGGYYEL